MPDHEELAFKQLLGYYKHYCHDWDGMAIDEFCPEFDACLCYTEKEKRRARHKAGQVLKS